MSRQDRSRARFQAAALTDARVCHPSSVIRHPSSVIWHLASGIWHLIVAILSAMLTLILASEAATTAPPGDAYQTAAYALLGLTMLVTAIATLIITPSAPKH